MMTALTRAFSRLPARQTNLLLIGLLLIVAALLWMLLRAPLASLRVLQAETGRLQATATDNAGLLQERRLLASQVTALTATLEQLDAPRNADRDLVALIGEVDRAALRYGVQTLGATPGPTRKALLFDEIPFDVEARGSYQALVDWMADIERSSPTLSLVGFELHPAETPPLLTIKMRIAAYRAVEAAP